VRPKPQTRGQCHAANYWELTQILVSNVDAANAVPVVHPSTLRAMKHTVFHLASYMPTAGTGTAGVVLILQGHSHAQPLCLVGELEAHRAMRPLVDFLVVGMPNIVVLPDISHIANDYGLHACLMQRGEKPRGLFVLNILDLMRYFL
jgi:hypothetical protein